MTMNWMVNPTKKKKSNLRRAMKIYKIGLVLNEKFFLVIALVHTWNVK